MLAILTTHPIQYQVPLWQALARDGRVAFEVWYLTSHAVQRSHDPEFGKEFAWDLEMLKGYPHRFLKVAAGAAPGSFWKCRLKEQLRDRMRESGVRAIWIQGWQVAAYWQAVREAKAAGIEVWLRGESNDLAPVAWWKKRIKRAVLSRLFKQIDRFLYIGSANRRLYEKFGVPKEKLFPAPYAVDNERFMENAEKLKARKAEIRKQWSIPEESFCVLFCGKFISKKRPMDLVKAAALLTNNSVTDNRAARVHLLFAGSGELGDQLRASCNVVYDAESGQRDHGTTGPQSSSQWSVVSGQKSEVRGQVADPPKDGFAVANNQELIIDNQKPSASFAGFLNQTEISRAYVAADVLVLPSDYGETWGLVVNEAMASGLSSIISDRCGCAEDLGISPNTTYPCGDIKSLAAAIARVQGVTFNSQDSLQILRQHSFCKTIDSVVGILPPNLS